MSPSRFFQLVARNVLRRTGSAAKRCTSVFSTGVCPFVDLAHEGIDGIQLFVEDIINRDGDIGFERIGGREAVVKVEECRAVRNRWRVGLVQRNLDHEGCVPHQQPRIAMVGMIVIRAMGEHHIRIPLRMSRAMIFRFSSVGMISPS